MMSAIKMIKTIDAVIGPVLLRLMSGKYNKSQTPIQPNRILIIRPGGMGDAILLLPSLKAISKKWAHAKIDILCEKRNQEVFYAVPYVNQIFSYKKVHDLLKIFKSKYDVVIDTEQSHFLTAIVTRLIKARDTSGLTSGFKVNKREKTYDLSIPYSQNTYEAESFWNLVGATMGFKEKFSWDFPYFKPEKTQLPQNLNKQKIICFFPGATTEERLWPKQRWARVMDWVSNSGWTCVLLGGKKEGDQCQSIIKHCTTPNIVNLCSQLTIAQTITLFETAAMLVSTDSGILHLGVTCNIPTISLFGPSSPKKWGPKGQFDQIIYKNIDCAPCALFGTIPPCQNKNICMREIQTDDVLKEIKKMGL